MVEEDEMNNLYCKCGNFIERTFKGSHIYHRNERVCEKCAQAGLIIRYEHYSKKSREKKRDREEARIDENI